MLKELWNYCIQSGFLEFAFTYPGNVITLFLSPLWIALLLGIACGIRDFLTDLSALLSCLFREE